MREFNYADIASMRRVGVRDLYRRGSELIDEVDAEGSILITRNGRPLAVLSPITDPALMRRRALEPVPLQESNRRSNAVSETGKARAEDPLPDIELDEVRKTILAEIAWFGGRPWIANDDDESRITMPRLGAALGRLEMDGLVTRRGSGFVPTRRGARFAAERIGPEFVEAAGRTCYYGFPPERLGYGPPGETT
jgi:prevent-host-death family protein